MLMVSMTELLRRLAIMGAAASVLTIAGPAWAAFHAVGPNPSAALERARERVEELKKQRDARLEQVQDKQEERQAEREKKKAEMQAKRLELKEAIQKRLNSHQQDVAARVSQNIEHLHERRCEHYDKVLDRLSRLLDKIEDRADIIEEDGANVADVDAAVAAARSQISTAQGVVDQHCATEYVVTLQEGQSIGEAIRTTLGQLKDAHKTVQAAVRQAWEAVHNAVLALAKAHGTLPSVTPIVTVSPVI